MERSVIRESYHFGAESLHFGTFETDRADYRFKCISCGERFPERGFRNVAPMVNVTKRLSRLLFVQPLHPICNRCREVRSAEHKKHPLYSSALEKHFQYLVYSSKSGARARGILFALDKDDALGMYLAQQGICALTGLEMDWQTHGSATRHGRNYKAPSIDRINSSGNYVVGNVQMVMQIANIMKNDLPQDTFVAMCRQIATHNVAMF